MDRLINTLPPIAGIHLYEQEASFINLLFSHIYYISPLILSQIGSAPPPKNFLRNGMLAFADNINWKPMTATYPAGFYIYSSGAWYPTGGLDVNGNQYSGHPILATTARLSPIFPPKNLFTYEQKKEFLKNCFNTLYYISPFLNDNFGKSEPPVDYKKYGFLVKADGVSFNPWGNGTSGWFWWAGNEWIRLGYF